MASEVVPVTVNACDDCIRFSGVFAAGALEVAFRRQHSHDDRMVVAVFLLLSVPGAALYSLSDYELFGTRATFFTLLGTRFLFLLFCAVTWWGIRKCTSPAQTDMLLLLWCLTLSAQTLYVSTTRPPTYTADAIINVLMVLMTYCVTPLPLTYQMISAVFFSVGFVALALARGIGEEGLTIRALAGACFGANALGALSSWQLNHRRRQAFAAIRREKELRSRLEKALAEVRTLRGYLSICAWCKCVRDEKEDWQQVEAYVQSHSHAQFSHSICPKCFEKYFGNVQPPANHDEVPSDPLAVR